jgi:hypothetical protein
VTDPAPSHHYNKLQNSTLSLVRRRGIELAHRLGKARLQSTDHSLLDTGP